MELFQEVILVIRILLEGGHDRNCWEKFSAVRIEEKILFPS